MVVKTCTLLLFRSIAFLVNAIPPHGTYMYIYLNIIYSYTTSYCLYLSNICCLFLQENTKYISKETQTYCTYNKNLFDYN